jgi:hypothetical protein
MRPGRARKVEDKINFVAPVTVPLFIGDVFNPVEVGPCGVVEQHINPPVTLYREIHQSLTILGAAEIAWLEDRHRTARCADRLYGFFGVADVLTRTHDDRPFPRECEGRRPADASTGSRDDAHFVRKPV